MESLDLEDCTLDVKGELRIVLERVTEKNPLTHCIYCRLSKKNMNKLISHPFVDSQSLYNILERSVNIEGVKYYWDKGYSEEFLGIYVKGELYKSIKLEGEV